MYEGRGTSAERGYQSRRWKAARAATLRRDPICTCATPDCHPAVEGRCPRASHVADHHPRSRKQLVAAGVADPDDPKFLRGLCDECHRKETARNQPGGWNQPKGKPVKKSLEEFVDMILTAVR